MPGPITASSPGVYDLRVPASTIGTPAPSSSVTPPPRPAGPSFRDHLAQAFRSLGTSERAVDGALERVARRGPMANEELIAFQATVYRHSLAVDIASRLVEKATSAVRQTLQSQQG